MSDEGIDEMPDDNAREPQLHSKDPKRIDAVSAVVGVLFIAIAILAFADRFWAEIDPVLVTGSTIIAAGAAMIAAVVLRHLRRN